jgi:hypothetical protein
MVCGFGAALAFGGCIDHDVFIGHAVIGTPLVQMLRQIYVGIAAIGVCLMVVDQFQARSIADTKHHSHEWCWPTHLSTGQVGGRVLAIGAFALLVGFFIPLHLADGEAKTSDEVATTFCKHFCRCEETRLAPATSEPIEPSEYFCSKREPPPGVSREHPVPAHGCYCLSDNRWIVLAGLDGNPQQFLYTTVLALLGSLLAFFSPRAPKSNKEAAEIEPWSIELVGFSCALFASIRWLRVYRLMPHALAGRVLFSYANHDISLRGTLFNDLTFLIIAHLLVLIWARWLRYATWLKLDVKPISASPWTADGEQSIADYVDETFKRLTHAYAHWKVTSLLIGLPFIYMTVIYWNIIWGIGDRNYLASAVAVHALWAITWIIISIPLMRAWRSWRSLVEELAIRRHDKMHSIASALHPVGMWSLVGLSLSGFAAFVTPIVHAWSKAG